MPRPSYPAARSGLGIVLALCAGLAVATPVAAQLFPSAPVEQQGSEAAQLTVRVQQLEEQIRQLTGQVEGLTFQITQLQAALERMQQDSEFRFQQLEGGSPAPAAPDGQGGATPPAQPPAEPAVAPTDIPEQGVVPLPGEQEFDPMFDDGTVEPPNADETTGSLGASEDPLVGSNLVDGQTVLLGALPVEQIRAENAPLNLSFTPGKNTGDPNADAQFTAAYEAIQAGDIAFAEEQFALFVAEHPDNPQAPDAANWLGEALLQRGANQEAAEVLLDAYQSAPDDPRAPDLLLRLAIALGRADERETACRTFDEIPRRFENLTEAFQARLTLERSNADCPPAG